MHDFLELTYELTSDQGMLIDTARLDFLVWPRLVGPQGETSFGVAGYRDALCGLIGETVTSVQDQLDGGIRLEFATRSLVIRPELDEVPGPEIAVLHTFDGQEWEVWRPGEDAFAYLASELGPPAT